MKTEEIKDILGLFLLPPRKRITDMGILNKVIDHYKEEILAQRIKKSSQPIADIGQELGSLVSKHSQDISKAIIILQPFFEDLKNIHLDHIRATLKGETY